jgi:hypothetical protein
MRNNFKFIWNHRYIFFVRIPSSYSSIGTFIRWLGMVRVTSSICVVASFIPRCCLCICTLIRYRCRLLWFSMPSSSCHCNFTLFLSWYFFPCSSLWSSVICCRCNICLSLFLFCLLLFPSQWVLVTPCFPQSINIIILAWNYGKLEGVNVRFDGPLYKRSMNVNYVRNMCFMTVGKGMW